MSIVVAAALALMSGLSETTRVGGSGGNRTVSMDCGSGAFIVGVTATGGRDGTFGFNLVRRIKFSCRTFNGTTPSGSSSQTVEAIADKPATTNTSTGSASCSSGEVIHELELYAASFIDRINAAECVTSTGDTRFVNANIGGDGGDRHFLACPLGEGLFKVEARVADAIDSVKGFCRAFATVALSVPMQVGATANPRPTKGNPIVIPVKSNKTFSFTITDFNAAFRTIFVCIATETDLLGGAALNPPDFKVELLNPSGAVVASKSFSNPSAGLNGVNYTIDANGTWKLRVTNLKKDVGSLNVTFFNAMSAQ